jgi:acetylornithine/N-succinyldiaminopimelate aminotransferase
MGLRLKQRLAGIKDEHDGVVEEVRGQGLMLGMKCKVPNQALLRSLAAQRLLTVQAGDNVVRLLPPLIVNETEIDEACAKIDAACVALETGAAAPA